MSKVKGLFPVRCVVGVLAVVLVGLVGVAGPSAGASPAADVGISDTVVGTVTDAFTGAAVSGADVRLWAVGGSQATVVTTTDSHGQYTLSGLSVGNFQVQFAKSGAYRTRWWNQQDNRNMAATVVIDGSGAAHQADATLLPNDSISGIIYDGGTGLPLPGATVNLFNSGHTLQSSVTSNSLGAYEFGPALSVGSYTVSATDAGYSTVSYPSAITVTSTTNFSASITLGVNTAVGTVAGTVVNSATSTGFAGASVKVYPSGSPTASATVTTDASGAFSARGLTPGPYQVQVTATGLGGIWYPNSTTQGGATVITVTANQTQTLTVVLPTTGTISGQLSDSLTSTRVSGMTVAAYPTGGANPSASTTTDSSGLWSLPGLTPGTYQLLASGPGYTSQWYNGSATQSAAASLSVTAGVTDSGIVISLVPTTAVTLTGNVTDASTSLALSGATVTVYNSSFVSKATKTTDSSGNWTVSGLAAGTYYVMATAPGYVATYYNQVTTSAAATPVAIASGGTATVPFALPPQTGTLTGTVTDAATSAVIPGATVQLYNSSLTLISSATTDSSGNWSLVVKTSSSYYVYVSAPGYASVWNVNSPNVAGAKSVSVGSNATKAVPMSLTQITQTGTLAGTTTDSASSAPVSGAVISVYQAGANFPYATLTSASDGTWSVADVPIGQYQLVVAASGYATQWYLNASSQATATKVTVTADAITTVPVPIASTGTLTGTVTDLTAGGGISGATVTVYPASSGTAAATATTNSSGGWSAPGLAPGPYLVVVAATNYVTTWYPNATSRSFATSVTVTSSTTTTIADPIAHTGVGLLEGYVTDTSTGRATSIPGGRVTVYPQGAPNGWAIGSISTAGHWTMPNLPVGLYQVQFTGAGYTTNWYANSADQAHSTTVMVTLNGDTVLNSTISPVPTLGTIQGTLTDSSSGAPLVGAGINVYPTGSGSPTAFAVTDSSGHWTIATLAPGSYQLQANAQDYTSSWYLGAATQSSATPVTVTAGGIATASFSLVHVPTTGTLKGTVKDSSTGQTLAGAYVQVVPAGFAMPIATLTTASDGTWTSAGLAPGDYQILVSAAGYAPSWYQNASSQDGATTITLNANATVFANVSLSPSASTVVVTGKVTDAANGHVIAGGFVRLFAVGAINGAPLLQVVIGADGTYVATVPAGTYDMNFSDPAYNTLWYLSGLNTWDATPITLAAGSTTTVNAALTAK